MQWMSEISAPSDAEFNRGYEKIAAGLDRSPNVAGWRSAFSQWDDLRRTWKS